MLGQAPGTDLLNQWVAAMLDDGMSLEDIAHHIASSDAFLTAYPRFLSNEDFASNFLGSLMGSEEVPDALMSLAVDLVVSLLNDGMTRGALALAAVMALYDIHDQGEAHAAYPKLGMVATAFANKIEVAEYYTVTARMEDPSSDVLAGVTSDADTVTAAKEAIDGAGADGQGQRYVLTPTIDVIEGGDGDDTFIAQPIAQVSNIFQDTLDAFDSIETGGGNDSVTVSGDYREDGLMVDLGDGDDTFDGNAGNSKSRVDGGAGTDTLKLSADGSIHGEGDAAMSIYSNFEILDVNLMAMGGEDDSKDDDDQSGTATLMLTVSSGVQALIVDSEAQVHRTAAGKGVGSGHYMNVVDVMPVDPDGTPASSIQEVRITGDAMTELKGDGLVALTYVDASGSGGGVTVKAG